MHRPITLVLSLLAGSAAAAQSAGSAVQRQSYREIERGFYVATEGGLLLLEAPSSGGPASTSGATFSVEAGYDVVDRVSLGGFALVTGQAAPAGYVGKGGGAGGDFMLGAFGARAHLGVLRFVDRNGMPRLFVGIRGGGGLWRSAPGGIFGEDQEPFFAGGPGLVYHSGLRHFAVGVHVEYVTAPASGASGFHVPLALRYTF